MKIADLIVKALLFFATATLLGSLAFGCAGQRFEQKPVAYISVTPAQGATIFVCLHDPKSDSELECMDAASYAAAVERKSKQELKPEHEL
jgi:hypothetical protein